MREPGEGEACKGTRFVVSGEISSIYKQDGRVRKVHSLILLPGLEEAKLLSKRLEAIGNIHSDGRPILGLSCRDLLEIMLETCPDGIFVPAHIWTPHFSMFGACSGFDTVEECFGDLAPHIHAVETGLSSDPPMNWRLSALDRFQLISNSDAHSPAKLGREANLLDTELSYAGLKRAVETGNGLANWCAGACRRISCVDMKERRPVFILAFLISLFYSRRKIFYFKGGADGLLWIL